MNVPDHLNTIKVRKGDRVLIWRKGVLVYTATPGKGEVEVSRGRK